MGLPNVAWESRGAGIIVANAKDEVSRQGAETEQAAQLPAFEGMT
jgi:hypothetical protein